MQKNDGAEQSAEQDVAERERSGKRRLQKQVGAWSGFFVAHGDAPLIDHNDYNFTYFLKNSSPPFCCVRLLFKLMYCIDQL